MQCPSRPVVADTNRTDSAIDAGMLRVMMAAAAYQARRVARTLKLSDAEREDAEHEILLVLLERRRFFDPARGPWTPFAHRIARQAAQSVADNFVAARQALSCRWISPPMDCRTITTRPTTLADTLQDHSASQRGGHSRCTVAW